jgi:hypothetical protein
MSPKLVSREFEGEWQFNGLSTIRPSGFPDTGAFIGIGTTDLDVIGIVDRLHL